MADVEALFLKLPRRDSAPRTRQQPTRLAHPHLNDQVLLTAVLKEQRSYLKQNRYAQELEAKYWHPRIKSMDDPIHPPATPKPSKDYPVNDRGFTEKLRHKVDVSEGVVVSCPRLKSAPGVMRRPELFYKLKKSKGHLTNNNPLPLGLPTKVFSPSKGSLFTRYSKVSLQPRPYTAGRQVAVLKTTIRTPAVIIPSQILLSRSPSPESRPSAYNSALNSRTALV